MFDLLSSGCLSRSCSPVWPSPSSVSRAPNLSNLFLGCLGYDLHQRAPLSDVCHCRDTCLREIWRFVVSPLFCALLSVKQRGPLAFVVVCPDACLMRVCLTCFVVSVWAR